ncbi:DUF1566 domain-containing protein [Herminiimonas sp. CN]|uniref:Lcl C-terminal domain-containing protein n=1 Tax=Herminiimonas sp. CN TaxID=1349818 RepID=UPI00047412D3|nr:DUF1566 domain-containing protein [Herminiimonas sp. CN]
MNAPTTTPTVPTVPGTPFDGGFYAGRINVDGQAFALIVAPKAGGEQDDTAWNDSNKAVEGATSHADGHANTQAMAAAGSKLAQWARDLRIAEHDDWYLPAQDELEIIYRNLKPGTEENYLYARSGINLSAVPSTYPYTSELPAQTAAEAFQEGSEQAFDDAWYWTSTQNAAYDSYAWVQNFVNGNQGTSHKSGEYRARAVRRLLIIE